MQIVILPQILDIAHVAAASASTSGAEVANVSIIQKEDKDGECSYCTVTFMQ